VTEAWLIVVIMYESPFIYFGTQLIVVIKGISDDSEKFHPIVNQQRAQLCEQAEKSVKDALSFYDIGIRLGIFVSDPDIRDLLVKVLDRFHIQRNLESYTEQGKH
jgi:hypothetical protein